MTLGAANALSALTCATGYYLWDFTNRASGGVTANSLCQPCPANSYSCTPNSAGSLITGSAVVCNAGFTLIGNWASGTNCHTL